MRKLIFAGVAIVALFAYWNTGSAVVVAQVDGNDNNISVMDDCLPGDATWDPIGGCTLKPHQGDVTRSEFFLLLRSPHTIPPNDYLIGHPAWRNEPSHLTARPGKSILVTNRGGRGHTFTKVENFGGGFIPALNIGLVASPECVNPASPPLGLNPGQKIKIDGLAPGLHKFICCIHPWMRATVRVE